jgi:hypothetical protein
MSARKLRIKIFRDGPDLESMTTASRAPVATGFTT